MFCGTLALASSSVASACRCGVFNAESVIRTNSHVFVADVVSFDERSPIAIPPPWPPGTARSFNYQVVENLKSTIPPPILLAVDAPSSCEFVPVVGRRYLFILWEGSPVIGYCSVSANLKEHLEALRVAAKDRR